LVPDAGLDIRQYLNTFAQQARKLTSIGLFAFALTAILLLYNIEESLNVILKAKMTRKLARRFCIYWTLLTLGPILMGAGLSLSTYALSLNVLDKMDQVLSIKLFLLKALPVFFGFVAFSMLYIIMPNREIKWRHAFPIFLVWIYLSWLVTLIGAEILCLLEDQHQEKIKTAN